MRIADAVMKFLELNGVECIFGIPSGNIAGFLDSLKESDIKNIVTKNEAGASFSATRYADLTGNLGVCMLGCGVGVNNAINGIADAYKNKLPLLVLTSTVRRNYIGKNSLQDFDNARILEPITKYSKNVMTKEDVLPELKKALEIALTPPYSPVCLSIPIDVQMADFDGDFDDFNLNLNNIKEYDDIKLCEAISEINKCNKGLILVGRGARGFGEEIKKLSSKLKWGVISTPNGKGVVNTDFEYYIGNYGFCSADGAIEYIENEKIDCILVLGSGIGQSATRDYNEIFIRDKKLIRIDWDKEEFNKVFNEDISVFYDLDKAIKILTDNVTEKNIEFEKPPMNESYVNNHTGLSFRRFCEQITDLVPKNTCFTIDIGDFINFIYKYMPIKKGMEFESSLNYASMGVGVGGSMGSYMANPERTQVVFVGDGGFYMNGTEILTARQYNMPIIYIVINNSMLGLVKHGMTFMFGDKFEGEYDFNTISIANIANAMGIDAVRIESLDDMPKLQELFVNRTSPLVVELITDGTEVVIDIDRIGNINKK